MTTTIKTTTSARPARRRRSAPSRAIESLHTYHVLGRAEGPVRAHRNVTLRNLHRIRRTHTTVSTHSATLHLTSSSSTPAYLCPAYVSHDRIDPRRGCRVPWSRATFGCARRRRRWTWRKSRRWFGQSSSSGDVDRRACVSSVDDGRRGGRR